MTQATGPMKDGEEECLGCERMIDKGVSGNCPDCDAEHDFEMPQPTGPIYPDIHVQLTGNDRNAFSIIGRVRTALREARVDNSEIDAYTAEAQGADYDHLLRTTMRWVSTS